MRRQRLILSIFSLIFLYSATAFAAPTVSTPPASAQGISPPPNAGETLRELEPEPFRKAPEPTQTLVIQNDDNDSANSSSTMRIAIKTITITGNTAIETNELTPLVAELIGPDRSLSDLRAGAARITAYYRQHGYTVARAYLPAQEIKDGAITINILEGRIDQIRLDNHSRVSDENVRAYLEDARSAPIVKSDEIDRGLLLLDDTPGVGGSRAALQPGASVGTSDLLVSVDPGDALTGNVSADNYGNRYTGQYRAGGTGNFNSPLHIGDLMTLGVLTSGQDLQYGRIAYQAPIGGDGLRMGVAFFDVHYKLGKEFKSIQAHGDAQSGSVFLVYSFIRSLKGNLTGTATWEEKRLVDYIDSIASVTDKRIHIGNLGLSGNYRDELIGGGVSGVDLSFALAKLDINSAAALATDIVSARTQGEYARLSYSVTRLQHITDDTFLSLAFSGQWASKNLDSSEKFLLGGIDGVRAYPQGEGVGDEGYLVRVEMRHDFMPWLQAIAFYDIGSVTTNKSPYTIPPSKNTRVLAGPGFGLNATVCGLDVKASFAWETSGGKPTSIPTSAVQTPTILGQINKSF
jgi:hemolysin activation/secretion protein